jgi:uncharacterized protein involved in exopolysaccharide biosynthesis
VNAGQRLCCSVRCVGCRQERYEPAGGRAARPITLPANRRQPMDGRSELPATTTTQYNYRTHPTPAAGSPLGAATQALATLRRAWRFPVLAALIGRTFAVCCIALTPTLYRSTARILIDTSMGRYLQPSKLTDEPFFDDSQMARQTYILSSESRSLKSTKLVGQWLQERMTDLRAEIRPDADVAVVRTSAPRT